MALATAAERVEAKNRVIRIVELVLVDSRQNLSHSPSYAVRAMNLNRRAMDHAINRKLSMDRVNT
jgi:hypothetical protein